MHNCSESFYALYHSSEAFARRRLCVCKVMYPWHCNEIIRRYVNIIIEIRKMIRGFYQA